MKRKHEEEGGGETKPPQSNFDMKKFFQAPDINQMDQQEAEGVATFNNPYAFRSWWNAIQALPLDNYEERAVLYQRALYYLPGSYKLWYNFLKESRKFVKRNMHEFLKPDETKVESFTAVVSDLFERALIYMSKMPKIWLDYAKYLAKECGSISQTRDVYDRALVALPIT